jgi:ATP-dependent Zn protease
MIDLIPILNVRRRMEMRKRLHDRHMKYDFRDGADGDSPVAAEAGGRFFDGGLAARSGLLRRISIHEAGHATVALVQGRRIEAATVVPGEDYAGKVSEAESPEMMADMLDLLSGDQMTVEVEAHARRHVVGYLAGKISEWLFCPAQSWMSDRDRSASSDLKLATAFARAICGSDEAAEALLAHARTGAREILETNAGVVLAIADALMARGTLSSFEIEEIIRTNV